ncbi:MAG: zinc ribbon domain-containing protein, partial [Oscillospiraceae bacterium]|nr:zinc ribbon domain-containing protein [Oscillospiraceae bacterium]
MFCDRCGAKLPDSAAVCTRCGAPQTPISPAAQVYARPAVQPAPAAKPKKSRGGLALLIILAIIAFLGAVFIGVINVMKLSAENSASGEKEKTENADKVDDEDEDED